MKKINWNQVIRLAMVVISMAIIILSVAGFDETGNTQYVGMLFVSTILFGGSLYESAEHILRARRRARNFHRETYEEFSR